MRPVSLAQQLGVRPVQRAVLTSRLAEGSDVAASSLRFMRKAESKSGYWNRDKKKLSPHSGGDNVKDSKNRLNFSAMLCQKLNHEFFKEDLSLDRIDRTRKGFRKLCAKPKALLGSEVSRLRPSRAWATTNTAGFLPAVSWKDLHETQIFFAAPRAFCADDRCGLRRRPHALRRSVKAPSTGTQLRGFLGVSAPDLSGQNAHRVRPVAFARGPTASTSCSTTSRPRDTALSASYKTGIRTVFRERQIVIDVEGQARAPQ